MEQKQYVFPLAANDTELDRVFLAALTFTVNSRDYGIFYIPGAYGQNIDGLGNIYGNSTPDSRVLYAADGSVVYWFIDSSSLSVDLSAAQNITIIRVVTV